MCAFSLWVNTKTRMLWHVSSERVEDTPPDGGLTIDQRRTKMLTSHIEIEKCEIMQPRIVLVQINKVITTNPVRRGCSSSWLIHRLSRI